jgi:hypothetical protein
MCVSGSVIDFVTATANSKTVHWLGHSLFSCVTLFRTSQSSVPVTQRARKQQQTNAK